MLSFSLNRLLLFILISLTTVQRYIKSELSWQYYRNQQNQNYYFQWLSLAAAASSSLPPSSTLSSSRKIRAATARKERLWPDGVIPYDISNNFTGNSTLWNSCSIPQKAMRHWENNTCITFIPRQPEHQNYIVFTVDKCGCCSYVGRKSNGPQAISIGKNCDKFGIVVHELGHVIGFWHEHTRLDRDQHVDIFYKSIQQAQDYNFEKLKPEEIDSLGEPYDYASIMHYARDTFSRSMYLDTILPKGKFGERPEIGQRTQLSPGDISQTKNFINAQFLSFTFLGFLKMTLSACGETLMKEYGELRMDGSGTVCQWRIIAAYGEFIVLNISTLDLPSPKYDCASERDNYLIVRDGYYIGSPISDKLCGGVISRTIFSTGNRLFIHAQTSYPLNSIFAHYIAVCGGHIIGDIGIIQSPRYPENYMPDEECKWLITVQEGYQLETHKDCIYDRLEIYDGTVVESTALLSKLCGQITTKSLVSHFNTALLLFISDSSVQKEEMDECKLDNHGCEHRCINKIGSYECQCNIGYSLRSDGKTCQSTCGGIIKASNGTFHSPNYPLNYQPLKRCVWQIEADDEYQIIVNFTHFDVEGMKSACSYDYLIIQNDEGLEERYCGYYNSLVYTSTTNRIKVLFVSDNTKKGFMAYFITDLDECRNNNAGCQQRCTNTIGSYQCECENGYVLADDGHNCKEGGCNLQVYDPEGEITSPNYPFDYPKGKNASFEEFMFEEHNTCKYDHIEIYDGGNSDATSLGIFCGTNVPPNLQSSSNQLFMTMFTDTSVDRRGFKAFYSSICGGNLKAERTTGFIYSHARYSDAEPNRGVNIRFAQFDLEREANCEFDYVEIYDGDERLEEYRIARYCGFIAEYRSSIQGTSAPFTSTTRRPPREPIINNNN
ncbi:Metalloendopeptidase [Dirofilaria immitis]|nr:Metalloendopeptidase [Dirofilaria immitis]